MSNPNLSHFMNFDFARIVSGEGLSHVTNGRNKKVKPTTAATGTGKRTRYSLQFSPRHKAAVRDFIGQSGLHDDDDDSGIPGKDQWINALFEHIKHSDDRMVLHDVNRWVKAHRWILQEALEHFRRVSRNRSQHQNQNQNQNQNPNLNQTQPTDGIMEQPAAAVGCDNNGRRTAAEVPWQASTSVQGPSASGRPDPELSSDSRRKLKKFQRVQDVVLELKELLEDDDLDICRAHIEFLNPLVKSLTRGQESILTPKTREELYQRRRGRSGSHRAEKQKPVHFSGPSTIKLIKRFKVAKAEPVDTHYGEEDYGQYQGQGQGQTGPDPDLAFPTAS